VVQIELDEVNLARWGAKPARHGRACGSKLFMPNTVRTVADIVALAEWPAEQLRT
jgi:hypothetical protein